MKNWIRAYGYGEFMVILAKEDESLLEHTENTLRVLKSIKEAYPEVPQICGIDNFWDILFYSLFLHDFGKASVEFQKILKHESKEKYWNYRHEVISASFVRSLRFIDDYSTFAIALGIITHHKDIQVLDERYSGFYKPSSNEYDIFYQKVATLQENIGELNTYFDYLPVFSKLYLGHELKKPNNISINEIKPVFVESVGEYLNMMDDYQSSMEENPHPILSLYGFFLKGFLTTCDHLASAGIYYILHASKTFNSYENIKDHLRSTQETASKTTGSTFLIAPTGSGKTEAALLWALNNQNEQYSKRLFYVLPFTASINAMYKRFQNEFSEELVGMLHGNSSYFLYKQLSEGSYEDKKKYVKELKNVTKKIYKPYKVLTPFQIIKYFFGVKGFEMGLSEMTGSLVIFDEIHAYDSRTTALILSILKVLHNQYKVAILIMSATLPSFILDLFSEKLGIDNIISLPKKELDKYTRHKVNVLEGSIFDFIENIFNDLSDGKKVLIVCNTVEDSQKIYEMLNVENSALLHSRFILRDRQIIESKLDNLDLLVGTQAIEVSLDISYDVLYSQPAPFDALIQRFGRVNRKGWEERIIKTANVCTIGSKYDDLIYDASHIEKTISSLKNVDILYESTIQELLDEVYCDGYNEEDQKIFDDVTNSFNEVYNYLVPFINDKSNNGFYELFDSVEVVPYEFITEYCDLVDEKKYFEAMVYTLNISNKQYSIQKSKNNIEYEKDTIFVNVPYDSEVGLRLNNYESEDETEIL